MAEPHTGAAAICVDELDAGRFKSLPNNLKRRPAGVTRSGLQLMDGHDPDPGLFCQELLAPSEQTPGRPALSRCEHTLSVARMWEFFNSIKNLLNYRNT